MSSTNKRNLVSHYDVAYFEDAYYKDMFIIVLRFNLNFCNIAFSFYKITHNQVDYNLNEPCFTNKII